MQEPMDGRSVALFHTFFDALVADPDHHEPCSAHFLSQATGDARKALAVIRRNFAERYEPARYEATAALLLKHAFVKQGSRQIALWAVAERMRAETSSPIVQRASRWLEKRIKCSGANGKPFGDLLAFFSLLQGSFTEREGYRNGMTDALIADLVTRETRRIAYQERVQVLFLLATMLPREPGKTAFFRKMFLPQPAPDVHAIVQAMFAALDARKPEWYLPTVELLCSGDADLLEEKTRYAELIALYASFRVMSAPKQCKELRGMGAVMKANVDRGPYLQRPGTERLEAFFALLG